MKQLYHEPGQNASGSCEDRPGYYAIIPADVRYDDRLPPNAKLLYGEITALANQQGYCYASNTYFCKLYGFSDPTITRLLKALEDNGYVRREVERDQAGKVTARRIWIRSSTVGAQPPIIFEGTLPSKLMGPPLKNDRENNTEEYSLSTRTQEKRQGLTLDGEQLDAAIDQCIQTLGDGNNWSGPERDAVGKLVREFYGPRVVDGKPPKHTIRGVNGLFRRMAPGGKCTATGAVNMLLESIERGWTSVYPRDERGRKSTRTAAPAPVAEGLGEEW